jgi:hypothetical protein
MPNQICLNWTMQSQSKAAIAKSSCEICALLRCYAVKFGNSLLTFWGNLSVSSSNNKKSQRENIAQLNLTDMILFGSLFIV